MQSDRAPDGTSGSNRFRKLLGYTTRAWREGYGEVELVIRGDHMNSLGIVHGGVYASMLDGAFGHAANWCSVPGNVRSAVTISITTTFLKSATAGRLIAIARLEHVEGRTATLSGEVVDEEGTVCAVGQASFLYLPGSEKLEGVPRKAKT